ncbi:Acg family FMN-binding oxidoreductase [Mycolicibacterium sp.]|uniref:Acg family FMN-binding oxidoreductase n=1 Tax=Mycolicibacterium sp. TaxID=2320850 RepID=UPI003D0B3179
MSATQIQLEVVVDAVELACRAPSLHNSQPWRWVASNRTVDLFLDPARLVATDTGGREALIGCGAVLDHFRVAMAAAGWEAKVRRFPEPADPQHLAAITFIPAAVTDDVRRRANAIMMRRTDRLPLNAPSNPQRQALVSGEQNRPDSVRVDIVADELRASLAHASSLSEAVRIYDSEYHAELSWWTADFVTYDGIPKTALISAAESDRVDVGRTFPVTTASERRSGVDDDRAMILVLSTDGDEPETLLRCGETLSALLLDATIAGMATCPLTHITEVPAGRDVVASLIDASTLPQVLVRVGVAPALEPAPPPTPRRPIADVLQIRTGATC